MISGARYQRVCTYSVLCGLAADSGRASPKSRMRMETSETTSICDNALCLYGSQLTFKNSDVGRLEVAMEDVGGVQVLEPAEQLVPNQPHMIFCERVGVQHLV
jgi:hypothetical protein